MLAGAAFVVLAYSTWLGADSISYLTEDRLSPDFCPDGIGDAQVLVSSWLWAIAVSVAFAAAAARRGRWAALVWWGRSFLVVYAFSFVVGFGALLTDIMPRAPFWAIASIGAWCATLMLLRAFARWRRGAH